MMQKRQFVWSTHYIDQLSLRDTFSGGVRQNAERLFYLADAKYNVTGVMKRVDGAWTVAERYLYDAYGKVQVRDGNFDVDADGRSDVGNTTLFTGRELDLETGLMYYRARYYHTDLGRFTARDPIGYFIRDVADNDQSGTRLVTSALSSSKRLNTLGSAINANSISGKVNDFNLYRYVGNSPINATDPTGTWRWFGWFRAPEPPAPTTPWNPGYKPPPGGGPPRALPPEFTADVKWSQILKKYGSRKCACDALWAAAARAGASGNRKLQEALLSIHNANCV